MDIINQIIIIVSTCITSLSAGGWFINYRDKKRLEKSNADKSEVEVNKEKVDLIDTILEKYQKTVVSAMGGHNEKHEKTDTILKETCETVQKIDISIKNIVDYLNGDYQKYLTKKQKSNGKTVSGKY